MKRISILGSTGSIGDSTLSVVDNHPERFQVVALSANSNVSKLVEQCIKYKPEYAVVADEFCMTELERGLKGTATKALAGVSALSEVSQLSQADIVMAAIVGAAGLQPTLAAVKAGKTILLANKEALVMSGNIFTEAVQAHNATLLPVDSEHNAIFQCLQSQGKPSQEAIKRIILTASGGPFLKLPIEALQQVTPEQACKHPNWSMGRKISVDSATMMNKGLEFIEAHWLFQLPPEQIDILIHPQSIIHSMVEYIDGSVIAQMGSPDMRIPIAHTMGWPERIKSGASTLDFLVDNQLEFMALDIDRFPCVELARQALVEGGTWPAILNAANEVAVDAFLRSQIAFSDIPRVIDKTLSGYNGTPAQCIEHVIEADIQARHTANQLILKDF